MRIVIAPDSFKESLSAARAAKALAKGWWQFRPKDEIDLIPMADGGEGTAEALVAATQGRWETLSVTGPLGKPVEASYGVLGGEQTAVVEMAAASGLVLAPPGERNPGVTTTRGTGELIRHALDHGARRLIVAIGGSATNDGGAGMAQALGYRFLDTRNAELPAGGLALEALARIDTSQAHPALAACQVDVACDVDNPLCGPKGASMLYGPQKGADPGMAARLDAALAHFAEIVERDLGVSIAKLPGSGAAGGLGGGLAAFAGGHLRGGAGLVAEACQLERRVRGAALVITGEGRLDGQSVHGKTPVGVARVARALGVPVVAVAGALGPGHESVYETGICAAFSLTEGPMPLEEAMAEGETFLRRAGERLARFWTAARGGRE